MKSGCHNVTLNLTKKTRQHSWFSLQIGGKKRSTYCNLFQAPPISYSSSSPVRKMIEEYVLFCITMVFCSGHKLLTKNVPLWLKLTLAALSREPSFSPYFLAYFNGYGGEHRRNLNLPSLHFWGPTKSQYGHDLSWGGKCTWHLEWR